MGQSTNDAYPTAIKIAILLHNDRLLKAARALSQSFHNKGDQFKGMVKMGRTEGQDAVPMTLGPEFHAFANQLDAEIEALRKCETFLCEQEHGGNRHWHRYHRHTRLRGKVRGRTGKYHRQTNRYE